MKFRTFTRYFGASGPLADLYNRLVDELNTGLRKLKFTENHECFQAEATIAATSDQKISHTLGVIPTGRIIYKQVGGGAIVDGDSDWTENEIYLKNTGATSAQIIVLIFK